MERREFLKSLMATTSGIMLYCSKNISQKSDRLGDILPKRVLGRTGEAVTMLGVGGYHIGWTTERHAQETIEAALAGGIRFFDTAESYNKGISEIRYGKYLTPKFRDLIFLMTKTTATTAEAVQTHLDESLKRLNTDYLDLWQVHSLKDPQDVENRISNGVLDVFAKAKESGKVRYIGFTGHRNPAAHQKMLERTTENDIFDTCQMPINVVDPTKHSFIKGVIPTLQTRNIALLAMKTLADGRFFAQKMRLEQVQWETDNPIIPNRMSIKDALNFVWSLPVTVLITGAENADLLREKIDLAKKFTKITHQQQEQLIEKVSELAEDGKVEYFKNVTG